MPADKPTYTVNGLPVNDPAFYVPDDQEQKEICAEADEVLRQAPDEPITDAEIEAFDTVARASFERELAKHSEIRPGSKEAEDAVRDAIRGK